MNAQEVPPEFHKSVSADGKRVSLKKRSLTRLPEWLRSLTSLSAFDVSSNQLTALPEWLGDLTALTSINLSSNHLIELPESLGKLTALTKLDLSANRLAYLPKSLSNLKHLAVLDLSGNKLAGVPEWLGKLNALTELNLRSTGLAYLPECLRDLNALTSLSVSQNYLTELPEWLGTLTSLTDLTLNNNQLAALPESIGNLTGLTHLYLDKNPLTFLPPWLDRLTGLTGLYLSQTQLTALPGSIGKLADLTQLYLHQNQLEALPESIGNLTKLTMLYLRANQLTTLPESIGKLIELSSLDVSDNRLMVLPESVGNLTKLTMLYLRANQLTTLPESVGNLTALTNLDLSRNRLTELPESVGNFTRLTTFNLAGNQLTRLPGTLAERLVKGLNLDVAGNPLHNPLPELVNRGADALAAYLGSLEDAIAQYEGKLLLVGEGNVGKTSLLAALRGDPFVEGRPTTHGIEIWPLTFRHPDRDVDITLRAWDFGGQEVYRVTHQFFFSPRALYAVVWNARQGQEQDEVEGWLRRIRLRAGRDAPTMVVATHCAERFPELDYPHLDQAFPNMLVGSFDVDSRTETGLAELRQAIGRQAAKLPQMGQLISPRWVAARDEILERAKAEPQIRYQQFVKICERHGIAGQSIVTLAQLMHDLGHIIYYGDDEGLSTFVIMRRGLPRPGG
jgi:internalin A